VHNYGPEEALEVRVLIAGKSEDYIPRIGPGESVEVTWPEDEVETYDSSPEGSGTLCDVKIEFTTGGRRARLDGVFYVTDGRSLPTFFQQSVPVGAPDRAREIR
jgi:hypothetical protein